MKTIIFNLPVTLEPVYGWWYEGAFSCKHFHVMHYDEGADTSMAIHNLHKQIATAMGARPDNKQTFYLKGYEGLSVYVTFHDGNAYFGSDVRPYSGVGLKKPNYFADPERAKSPHWEHEDWDTLDAESHNQGD